MDVVSLLQTISKVADTERSKYHVTLGGMIEALSGADDKNAPVWFKSASGEKRYPGRAASYRGYYSDLAFRPDEAPKTVGEFLADCRAALGSTFEGYKGGDYQMSETTPLWIASYGTTSDSQAIISTDDRGDSFFLLTRTID